MTNVKEFHCHMRMNLQPFEENRMYCALPGQRRECTTWPVPNILLLSVQFEINSFPIFATFEFSEVIYMNTKLRFQGGPGAPNFSGAPGPMWS